jgi:hypothetical protein
VSTVISHYDASGGAVAWTGEGSGEAEKWTRTIPGIDGSVTATEKGEGNSAGAVASLVAKARVRARSPVRLSRYVIVGIHSTGLGRDGQPITRWVPEWSNTLYDAAVIVAWLLILVGLVWVIAGLVRYWAVQRATTR